VLKGKSIGSALTVVGLALVLSGCAAKITEPPLNHPDEAVYEGSDLYDMDPYEPFNRAMFSFNNQFNRYVAQPVSDAYNYVPYQMRKGIANIFINLGSPATIGNDLLQGNFRWALEDTTRFVLNTTLGLLGLFDVASDAGLPPRSQGFGLTLAKWGVTYSPYLVLPVLGPTTVRGGVGMVVDYYTSVFPYIRPYSLMYSMDALYFVQTASGLLPKQEMIGTMALDPYLALRTAYLQNSDYLVEEVKTEGASDEDY
jgi:phospholipid-binding lipoprotein MlaA